MNKWIQVHEKDFLSRKTLYKADTLMKINYDKELMTLTFVDGTKISINCNEITYNNLIDFLLDKYSQRNKNIFHLNKRRI